MMTKGVKISDSLYVLYSESVMKSGMVSSAHIHYCRESLTPQPFLNFLEQTVELMLHFIKRDAFI